ncbi:hypothetical protein BS17DRAFT_851367 [Gyrodon lividus]|nr:hypothetical protein BS17DRAFT_851367 [Gyrodon lividus]
MSLVAPAFLTCILFALEAAPGDAISPPAQPLESPAQNGTTPTANGWANMGEYKEQLKSYGKGLEPFNWCFCSSKSLYSWWEQVQKDNFGIVLGFAIITAHAGTDRTSRHSKIKITSKLDSGIVQDLAQSSKLVDKSLPPTGHAAPRPHLETLDADSGSGMQEDRLVHDDSTIDDGNDWLDKQCWLDPAAVGVERRTFTLVSQAQAETANALRRDPGSSSGVAKPPPSSMDWDSWE